MAVAVDERQTRGHGLSQRSSPLDVILVALVLGFAALGLSPLGDPDLWWHLRTGELVVESGFTTTDPWSQASGNPWVLHEWGVEVLMYLSYATAGYRGVLLLHVLGMLVLAAILLRSIRREASPGAAVIVALLALVAVIPGSAERPQLVSWILLAATLPALRKSVDERRPPWWLVPVVWVWANLHGLWAAALVIFAALVLGLVAEVGLRAWRTYRPFVIIGLVCAAVVMLTPNGPMLLLTPLHVRDYAGFVSEWRPPSLLSPYSGSAFLLLAVVVVGWARSARRFPASEIMFVVAVAFIGLSYQRTIPVLVIGVAPLAAAALQQLLSGGPPRPMRQSTSNRSLAAGLVVGFVVMAGAWLPHVPAVKRGAPWMASRVLDALPGRAHVLNEYVLGGWILWTARDTSPAIDGRTEIYRPEYVAKAMGAPQMTGDWQDFIAEENFDAAWLDKRSPLVFGLKRLGWTTTYRDSFSLVLLPPRAE